MICPSCLTENLAEAKVCSACNGPLKVAQDFRLPANTLLAAGKYCLKKVLGQGSFGITYQATDQTLNRLVAIKEFFPEGSTRDNQENCTFPPALREDCDQAIERFLQEGQLLARLDHPGVVGVYEVFAANQTAYMVMEYIEGQTLQRLVEAHGGGLPEAEIIPYIAQVAEALNEIHDQGLLHRDIKPENVMLTATGRAVLIDFGAARVFEAGKTLEQSVILTPGYAPLEQYAARIRLGPYTDIYALAGTLYFALTARHPIAATDRINGVPLPTPRSFNDQISPTVERGILWGLAQRVEERPQDTQIFLKGLLGTARPEVFRPPIDNKLPTLELTGLPPTLTFQVKSLGELLRHGINLTNPGVGTLKGYWDVRPDVKDHQVWLRLQPQTFKGNRVETTLVINTNLLRNGSTYRRWVTLTTNTKDSPQEFEIVVEVAPNDLLAQQLNQALSRLVIPGTLAAVLIGGLSGFFGGQIPAQAFSSLVALSPWVLNALAWLIASAIGWLVGLALQNRGYEVQVGIAGGCMTTIALAIFFGNITAKVVALFQAHPAPWGNSFVFALGLGTLVFGVLLGFLQLALKPQYEQKLLRRQQQTIDP